MRRGVVLEVVLHGHHQRIALNLQTATDHAVLGVVAVAAGRRSIRSHCAPNDQPETTTLRGHVVSAHLLSVHVDDQTALDLISQLVSGHSVETRNLLTRIHRSDLVRAGGARVVVPLGVIERTRNPVVGRSALGADLPNSVLLNTKSHYNQPQPIQLLKKS